MTKRKFKSDAFEAIHSAVAGMHRSGTVDKETMRHFDEACLAVTEEFSAREIKQLRETYNVSQPVFARYLNTSESTVEKWESGAKRPSGTALKHFECRPKAWIGCSHVIADDFYRCTTPGVGHWHRRTAWLRRSRHKTGSNWTGYDSIG